MDRPLRAPGTKRTVARGTSRTRDIERRSCGPWIYPSEDPDYPYQGTWEDIGPRKRSRYRWLLAGGAEIQNLSKNGTPGSDIFPLRPNCFDPEQDPEGSGHDETGVYRPWYVDGIRGMVVDGVGP